MLDTNTMNFLKTINFSTFLLIVYNYIQFKLIYKAIIREIIYQPSNIQIHMSFVVAHLENIICVETKKNLPKNGYEMTLFSL